MPEEQSQTRKIWWANGPPGVEFEKAIDLKADGTIIGAPYETGWYRITGDGKVRELNFSTGEERDVTQ